MKNRMTIAILAFLLPLAVAAQTKITTNGVSLAYTFNDSLNYATVVEQPDVQLSGSVVIPEHVSHRGRTYEVKFIGERAFFGQKNLHEVTIPKTIASIGGHAFKECSSLKIVNYNANRCVSAFTKRKGLIYSAFEDVKSIVDFRIGPDVQSLPAYLCWGCTGIGELTIPENVQHMDGAAFIDCSGLTHLNFNAVRCVSMYSLDGSKRVPAIVGAQVSQVNFGSLVEVIPDYAFFGFGNLTTVTIPESVKMLGGGAFRECKNLTSVIFNASDCSVAHSLDGDNIVPSFNNNAISHVTFGQDVTIIPDYLFWGCKGLTEILLPDNVERIGIAAFWGCQGLRSVVIPESVEQIGGRAFGNCSNLNTIYFNAVNCVNLSTFENEKPISAFENKALTTVVFGREVKRIPDNAFAECTALVNFSFPESVEYIGSKAFFNCRSLQSVTIPAHVNSIGGLAFTGCDALTSVRFLAIDCAGVSKMENGLSLSAFQSCNSIKNVVFGDSVRIVPDFLFSNCAALEHITIPRSVEFVGTNSFKNCTNLRTLNFNAERCLKLTSDSSTVSAFMSQTLQTVNIGPAVTVIPDYAFAGCSRLANIQLPASLERIGRYAFDGCVNIKKITIPEKVEMIAGGAFRGCLNLRTVQFNAADCKVMGAETDTTYLSAFAGSEVEQITFGAPVVRIPDYAFYGSSSIEKLVFGKQLREIGKFAFAGAESLGKVELPEGLETIGGGAFADCKSLTTIYYNSLNLTSAISVLADTVTYPFTGENKISNIAISKKVTSIPEGLFYNSRMLADVELSKNIESVGGMAFAHCPELHTVYFEAVKCMSAASEVNGEMRSAFEECEELTRIEFGTKIEVVPDYVCYNCKSLIRVILPVKGSRIGDHAFDGCTSLVRCSIAKNITAIGEGAFRNTGLTNVSLHEGITEIGDNAFGDCKALRMIRIKKKNPYFMVVKNTQIVPKP